MLYSLFLLFIDFMCSMVCMHAQSCPVLCDPMNYSPPDSSVHEIFQQEYWSSLPFPPSGDLPYLGIKPKSFTSPALAGGFFTTSTTWEAPRFIHVAVNAIILLFL